MSGVNKKNGSRQRLMSEVEADVPAPKKMKTYDFEIYCGSKDKSQIVLARALPLARQSVYFEQLLLDERGMRDFSIECHCMYGTEAKYMRMIVDYAETSSLSFNPLDKPTHEVVKLLELSIRLQMGELCFMLETVLLKQLNLVNVSLLGPTAAKLPRLKRKITELRQVNTSKTSPGISSSQHNSTPTSHTNMAEEKAKQARVEVDIEQARLAVERAEKVRVEQAQVEKAREQAKVEQTRVEQAKLEQARVEQAKVQQARVEQAKVQQARVEKVWEQAKAREQARVEQAKVQQARVEQVKVQQARVEKVWEQAKAREQVRVEQAKVQQARVEQAKVQQARVEKVGEQAKVEKAREQARVEQAKVEQARVEQTKADELQSRPGNQLVLRQSVLAQFDPSKPVGAARCPTKEEVSVSLSGAILEQLDTIEASLGIVRQLCLQQQSLEGTSAITPRARK